MNTSNGKTNGVGFATGGARPGAGRPKNSERMTIQSLNLVMKMEKLGYDPIEEMVSMATDKTLDDNLRASIHKELAQYIAPKRKSVDFAVGQATEFNLSIKNYGTGNGDRDSISLGSEALSDAAVELSGNGREESSGDMASQSGEGPDNDQLDPESSG
tara:strand:- start:1504 stop:1977 length:474 start_codon:yes stop_codon:yes gene_type:complete